MRSHPVLEVAILNVRRGQAAAFLEAFSRAEPIIAAASGYGGHELRRCVEDDHRFLLLVWWDTVESHELGFRQSAAYQQWKHLLHEFYEPFPVVEHYVRAVPISEDATCSPVTSESRLRDGSRVRSFECRRREDGMRNGKIHDIVLEPVELREPRALDTCDRARGSRGGTHTQRRSDDG